ncbi:MAG: ABC transporter ATP-binding protein [Candidatus Daviesbacteria bacterium]|nr:ABC transporter ATP-binding protein [Candidatus Daviesbacteria bacterium]
MKNYVLEVNNLSKQFKNVLAVNNISFNVKGGEIVGLLGPNGAGKTTTIQMLLGVLSPTNGSIKYFGNDFNTHREEILGQVNFCSSYIKLPWRMKVWENLDVIARLYGIKNRQERIDKLLQIFEMLEFRNNFVSDLSAGQTMRINLVKAFLNYPKLILLDEPTASLDPEVAQKVRDFLLKEQKEFGVSMLLTSHNMAEVEQLCDRVIFLNKGEILEEDTPEALAARIETTRVELLFTANKEKAANLISQEGWQVTTSGRYLQIKAKEQDIAKILSLLTTHNLEFTEISIDKPNLEDFFLKTAKEVQDELGPG